MADYNSSYTGIQIDTAVGKALNPDTTVTATSSSLITSGAVASALDTHYVIAGLASGVTLGDRATAEGQNTVAQGVAAHAEGNNTKALGNNSHAEGSGAEASGGNSHAEGQFTVASNINSHAEGQWTEASGRNSHTEGLGTIANHAAQHVFGEYNIPDSSEASSASRGDYVEIVGNGANSSNLSNARTLDWNGNEILSGKLTVGAAPSNNMDVTTKQYVDNALNAKAPLASPALTGTPTAPTATAGTNTTQISTTAFVNTAVGNLKATTVNPNLLDNWYFINPVNQRGNSSYVGAVYGIDRWISENASETATIQSDGLLWANGAATVNGPFQRIEATRTPKGTTLTLSLLGDLSNVTALAWRVSASPYIATSRALTAEEKSEGFVSWTFTNSYDTTGWYGVSLYIAANSSAKFKAVKLELGDTQTLAHKKGTSWVLNEIPYYGDQLARCQRYLFSMQGDYFRASILTANLLFFSVLSQLRDGATITIVNDNLVIRSFNGTNQTGFTFSVITVSRQGKFAVQASKTSHGLTDGTLSSSGITLFSAEL